MYQAAAAIAGLGMNIAGTALAAGEAGDRRKKIAALANFPDLNIDAEQIAAIQGNKAALPRAEELATSVNTFNRDALLKQLRATIPGYDAIVGGQSNLIQSQLKGELTSGQMRTISQRASERGLFQGVGGSQFGKNLEAMGLVGESQNTVQRGFTNALSFLQNMKSVATAPTFDVTSMFQTAAQRISQKNYEQQLRLNINMAAAGLPTGNELWGGMLKETGGALMGAGLTGMAGGMGGGGGGSTPPAGTNSGQFRSSYVPFAGQYWDQGGTMTGG